MSAERRWIKQKSCRGRKIEKEKGKGDDMSRDATSIKYVDGERQKVGFKMSRLCLKACKYSC